MYKNLVLWKLKAEAQGRRRDENTQIVKEKVKGLKASIPEIEVLEVGVNIGDYGDSFYDIGMYATVKIKEDFLKYIHYQSNYEVVDFIQPVIEAEKIVDFV